jgi:hypothetical protein
MNISSKRISLITFILFTLNTATALAEERSVTIRGDKESPSVLYLVPWKNTPSSQGNTDLYMDLDYEFSPLSRSEVVREVRYFKELGYDTKSVKKKRALKVIKR